MDSIEAARAERSLREAEVRDLEEQVRAARSAARRHTLWAVLGVSPGAAIPLRLSVHELGLAMIVVFSVFVTGVERWRALQARMDAVELRQRLLEISSPDRASAVHPSDPTPSASLPREDPTGNPES